MQAPGQVLTEVTSIAYKRPQTGYLSKCTSLSRWFPNMPALYVADIFIKESARGSLRENNIYKLRGMINRANGLWKGRGVNIWHQDLQ